jgi:hypothetical protein
MQTLSVCGILCVLMLMQFSLVVNTETTHPTTGNKAHLPIISNSMRKVTENFLFWTSTRAVSCQIRVLASLKSIVRVYNLFINLQDAGVGGCCCNFLFCLHFYYLHAGILQKKVFYSPVELLKKCTRLCV